MYAINRIRLAIFALALMLAATQALAQTWIGNAAAIKQISTITVANTWAAADTGTVTINGKAMIVTVGSAATTADVAEAIADAFNAVTRLDGTGSPNSTSNFGGQEFGEFAEVTASFSGSVLTLIGNTAGKPFTFAVSEVTAGSGTLAAATPQVATGPNFWSNAKNWDTGSVPVNDGLVVFRDSDIDCKYGLPAGSLEVTLHVYKSFTGQLGLYEINTDNQVLPYREYRPRAVELDASGSGTEITHRLGIGSGNGSVLVNLYHHAAALIVNVDVFGSGTPQLSQFANKAVNLVITQTDGDGVINVRGGSVNIDELFGGIPEFATLRVSGDLTDVRLRNHNDNDLAVEQTGGTLLITHDSDEASGLVDLQVLGGTCSCDNLSASGVAATVYNSVLAWNTTETIADLVVGAGGQFNAEQDNRAFTITDCDLFGAASLLDEFSRATFTNGIDLNRCGVDDVTIRLGNNRRLEVSDAP